MTVILSSLPCSTVSNTDSWVFLFVELLDQETLCGLHDGFGTFAMAVKRKKRHFNMSLSLPKDKVGVAMVGCNL